MVTFIHTTYMQQITLLIKFRYSVSICPEYRLKDHTHMVNPRSESGSILGPSSHSILTWHRMNTDYWRELYFFLYGMSMGSSLRLIDCVGIKCDVLRSSILCLAFHVI